MAENINKNLILDEAFLAELESQTAEAVKYADVIFAKEFVYKIWPQLTADITLSKNRPEMYERLERLYYLNTVVIMPALGEKRLLELMEQGLVWYFKELRTDYNLWNQIRGNLVSLLPDERDLLKEKIRQALLRNNGLITKNKIRRNEKEYPPSIKEWLIDYTSVVGTGKTDALKINQYLSGSRNFQSLSPEEKEGVRALIEVYEKLKRSTFEVEGLEEKIMFEVDGRVLVLDNGRVEDWGEISPGKSIFTESEEVLAAPTNAPTELPKKSVLEKEVLVAYQGDEKQQRLILEEEQNINSRIKDDLTKLRAEFFTAVQKQNVVRTVALLRVLAQKNDLAKFLLEDQKLNKFLSTIWIKRYGQEFAAEFSKNPDQIKFIRLFLRYILEERLGMTSSDAARIGLQIGNILVGLGKKEYNKMAYFDVKKKGFVWFD